MSNDYLTLKWKSSMCYHVFFQVVFVPKSFPTKRAIFGLKLTSNWVNYLHVYPTTDRIQQGQIHALLLHVHMRWLCFWILLHKLRRGRKSGVPSLYDWSMLSYRGGFSHIGRIYVSQKSEPVRARLDLSGAWTVLDIVDSGKVPISCAFSRVYWKGGKVRIQIYEVDRY